MKPGLESTFVLGFGFGLGGTGVRCCPRACAVCVCCDGDGGEGDFGFAFAPPTATGTESDLLEFEFDIPRSPSSNRGTALGVSKFRSSRFFMFSMIFCLINDLLLSGQPRCLSCSSRCLSDSSRCLLSRSRCMRSRNSVARCFAHASSFSNAGVNTCGVKDLSFEHSLALLLHFRLFLFDMDLSLHPPSRSLPSLRLLLFLLSERFLFRFSSRLWILFYLFYLF